MKTVRCLAATFFFAVIFSLATAAQPTHTLQPFITSGLASPVHMTSSHDGTGRLFIVQQAGTILVIPPGSNVPNATPFLDITTRVRCCGERGLLGLDFHPRYFENGRFFVYYTRQTDGAIQIDEYVNTPPLTSNVASTTQKIIITIPHPTFGNHNGGTVMFGPDGYLYAGPGDGGSANDPGNNGQNINSLLGKIIRLDVDNVPMGQDPQYNIPPTNPYAGATPGADEIFAIGMRNPYRFSFDRGRPRSPRIPAQQFPMWVADVGQGNIEEIDLVTVGGNYGWRLFEGTNCTGLGPASCTSITHSPPLFQYTHVNAGNGFRCSVTGGYTYRGRARTLPGGSYVYADYCSGEIFLYNNNPAEQPAVLFDTTSRIVGIAQDDRGEIYIIFEGGAISRIIRTPPPGPGEGIDTKQSARSKGSR